MREGDQKTKTIGMIATALITVSTLVTFWLVVTTTQRIVDASIKNINTELMGY